MSAYISPDTVRNSLTELLARPYRKVGRTAVMGWLLLHAKLPAGSRTVTITSQGPTSVEPELKRFFSIAPGTPLPYINPFGMADKAPEYLTVGYERRGTYTHLYPSRNLERFLKIEKKDEAFEVTIPQTAATEIHTKLGDKIPWQAAAGFLLRHEAFDPTDQDPEIKARLKTVFQITDEEFDALFVDSPEITLALGQEEFIDTLSSLPSALQPKINASSHSSMARAGRELVSLASPSNDVELTISDELRRRIQRAVQRSKAIALLGPPGTAKSTIWAKLLEEAVADPQILGVKSPPSYLCYTAEVDWTARTIIGGYYPQEDGRLVFREGYLLQAIRNNQIFWIDEMNRADLDRVLGPALTFLAGQNVDLGPDHLGTGASKSMVLVWSKDEHSGMKEDDEQRVYFAGTNWRMIGTYNNVDRGRVFPMGSALLRRWALIPVPPLPWEEVRNLLQQVGGLQKAVVDILARAYQMHRDFLQIGPAPFIEMAHYVAEADLETSDDGPATGEELELLRDAYVIYMGQQVSRIDPERRKEFLDAITNIFGAQLALEVGSFWEV
ncbi:AAA family ATPase [Stutzerimonas frequens]|uniref:AAA family ATPase n=1 Tax=Stutzerimonas frequens TaxID=2968969 RepID=UPI0012E24785|nr:AAA family ATPase [Stutzerimonas frequens]MUT70829.1 AAA domain-containing protein [Stutzerimonas frequens]